MTGYRLTDDDLAQAEYAARKFSGCWWTGTSGTLASWLLLSVQEIRRLRMERQGSQEFFGVLDEVAQTHSTKSADYGDRGGDPLANIRNGAEMINVEPWRACLLRMSDKMQRLKSYCKNGSSKVDGPEDDLIDICSYAAIALVMYRESKRPES